MAATPEFEIPMTPKTPRQFRFDLDGTTYVLKTYWLVPAQNWMLDIYQEDGLTAVVTGLPFVTPLDILAQFKYLGIGVSMYVQSDVVTNEVPTFESLGIQGHVYFEPDDAQS